MNKVMVLVYIFTREGRSGIPVWSGIVICSTLELNSSCATYIILCDIHSHNIIHTWPVTCALIDSVMPMRSIWDHSWWCNGGCVSINIVCCVGDMSFTILLNIIYTVWYTQSLRSDESLCNYIEFNNVMILNNHVCCLLVEPTSLHISQPTFVHI